MSDTDAERRKEKSGDVQIGGVVRYEKAEAQETAASSQGKGTRSEWETKVHL